MQNKIGSLLKIPLYILTFLLIGLLFGYTTFKILSFSRTVEVPSLYGKSTKEAHNLLTKKGLYLKIEGEEYDSTVMPGQILKQDVPAGEPVKEGREIKVVLSKRPEGQSMLLLINETLSGAESLLLQKRLKIAKIIKVHSNTVEKDRIVAQDPEPGEILSNRITVLVSLGPHEVIYYCPDFEGMHAEEAKDLIETLNLKIETEGDGNRVKAQKPKPDTYIKTGDTIHLHLESVNPWLIGP
jgi:beta-lactam-binding protein with PASTA domain